MSYSGSMSHIAQTFSAYPELLIAASSLLTIIPVFLGTLQHGACVIQPTRLDYSSEELIDMITRCGLNRLNAFGYLYLARLDPRFADSGNAGQLDILLALAWVRANIAAFGGDPLRITVFGQSGGGAKIATMLGMSAATGLFHRAMTMSGQQVTASGPLHAGERARVFMAKAGARSSCNVHPRECHRAVWNLDPSACRSSV